MSIKSEFLSSQQLNCLLLASGASKDSSDVIGNHALLRRHGPCQMGAIQT